MLGVANVALRAAGWAFVKPSANPISRWELDETSSAEGVFEDRDPAFVRMIVAGIWADMATGSLVEEVGGTSAYTDGSAYATIPADEPEHNLAALTISFYYQRNSAAARQILLAAGDGTQAGDFSIEILSNGRLRGYHVGADHVLRFFESPDGITGTDLQVGTAHRIDLTLGLQGARIYLDGSELVAAAITANTNGWNNAQDKYLGRWTDGIISPAVGAFDRVRLWNRQLAADEIAELEPAQTVTLPPPDTGYDVSVASFGPNVVSYWKFENDGVDQRGTQDAAISGTPDLNVQTIVDLDRIAEGAPADGTCIAWPGSSGIYAQVAHNPAHKTAEGSIVVTFQRDTANQKSILVAADRPVGGTSSGPGGLSIEVESDGAPRCFLRRQSNGAPLILLGQAGDVALDEAYTLIFKWGSAGLSLALWNEDGTLVRRVTDPLADGVTGTSPIRFGIWHDGSSGAHDGPFGRVVWLDRRVDDEEEVDLARARTISPEVLVGDYTPFPFVTSRTPPVSHEGCAARPPYAANDPRSASFIDPMSGLEVFRITPDRGAKVLINNSTDTGLNFPAHLKPNNNTHADRTWNSDGTLLLLSDSKSRSSDPSSPCRSALIDVDGNHGNSGPWRFLRAFGTGGLGDPGVSTTNFMWDHLDPLRAYVFKSDGLYEWWPAGGDGHSVGEQNFLFAWPSGFTGMNAPQDHPIQSSYDGVYWMVPCRRTSDGKRGGMRMNLITGAFDDWHPHPLSYVNDNALDIAGTSPDGVFGYFNHAVQGDPKSTQSINMTTGARSAIFDGAKRIGEHPELFVRDGETFLLGGLGDWNALSYPAGVLTTMGNDESVSVSHVSCRAYKDLWEIHGGGTATSGLRYALIVVSNPSSRKGIMGLRLDEGDVDQWRYICHHRSNRTENASEVHPMPSPDFSMVYFNSNWNDPGVETDASHINNYIVVIPDAWRSPNNDGS